MYTFEQDGLVLCAGCPVLNGTGLLGFSHAVQLQLQALKPTPDTGTCLRFTSWNDCAAYLQTSHVPCSDRGLNAYHLAMQERRRQGRQRIFQHLCMCQQPLSQNVGLTHIAELLRKISGSCAGTKTGDSWRP